MLRATEYVQGVASTKLVTVSLLVDSWEGLMVMGGVEVTTRGLKHPRLLQGPPGPVRMEPCLLSVFPLYGQRQGC